MRESILPEWMHQMLGTRRGRLWLLGTAGAVLLLFVLVTWLRFGLVRVHYTTADPVDADRIEARAYEIEGDRVVDTDAFTTIFGLALVPRSTRHVQVTSGSAQTLAPIAKVPWFGLGRFDARLEPQLSTEKLGAGLGGCVFGAGDLYSYDCAGPRAVQHYERPEKGAWGNKTVRTLFPGRTVKARPYADGLLGLAVRNGTTQTAQLFHLTTGHAGDAGDDGLLTMPVPAELLSGGAAYLNVETDTTDRENRGFVLYNMFTGQIVRYDGFGTSAGRHTYQRRTPFDRTTDLTQCLPLRDDVYCYTGLRGGSPDSEGEGAARGDARPAAIEVFGPGRADSYTASQVFGLERFYLTGDGEVFLRSTGRLYRVALTGGRLVPTRVSGGVSAVAAGRGLYWTTSAGLYHYEPPTGEARLVFSARNLRLSELTVRSGEVVFNAFVEDDEQSEPHTYRLGDTPQNGPRWEDKLPYSTRLGLPVVAMDYTADRMWFRIRAGGGSGTESSHRDAFESAKQLVIDRLTSDGFDTGRLDLVFTP